MGRRRAHGARHTVDAGREGWGWGLWVVCCAGGGGEGEPPTWGPASQQLLIPQGFQLSPRHCNPHAELGGSIQGCQSGWLRWGGGVGGRGGRRHGAAAAVPHPSPHQLLPGAATLAAHSARSQWSGRGGGWDRAGLLGAGQGGVGGLGCAGWVAPRGCGGGAPPQPPPAAARCCHPGCPLCTAPMEWQRGWLGQGRAAGCWARWGG